MHCRCHPAISSVPNKLFYNNQLIDGCTALQRPALLPGLVPVCFLEVRGSQHYSKGSSSACNKAEGQAVLQLVQQLTSAGVAPCRIGVICFFRAQVHLRYLAGTLKHANTVLYRVLPLLGISCAGCEQPKVARDMWWLFCCLCKLELVDSCNEPGVTPQVSRRYVVGGSNQDMLRRQPHTLPFDLIICWALDCYRHISVNVA